MLLLIEPHHRSPVGQVVDPVNRRDTIPPCEPPGITSTLDLENLPQQEAMMSIKRFNPTCAAARVWYIMSPVGTRGLTWSLGGEATVSDLVFVGYLLLFTLLVGGSVVLWVYLDRRFTSLICPSCKRVIPKEVALKHVPCPDCGMVIAPNDSIDSSAQIQSPCNSCGADARCTTLWDGQCYCESCLFACSPELQVAAFAPYLSEQMPYSVKRLALRAFLFAFGSVLVVPTAVAMILIPFGRWALALQGYGVLLVVASPVIVLYTVAGASFMPLMRPSVMVWNGQVIARVGTHLLVACLSDCTWKKGHLSHVSFWKHAFLLSGEALIVKVPTKTGVGQERVAVGFTDRTKALWESFFSLAEVHPTK